MTLSENILVPSSTVPANTWNGPDTSANTRRLKATKGNINQDLCERLAAAAKERGRPLNPTEYALVAEGKPLPAIVVKEREKTVAELAAEVAGLKAQLEAKK